MASGNLSGNGARLGTRFRGKLAAAFEQRGSTLASLWYAYSPKTKRDWVLTGDLAFDHFVSVESDSTIRSADHAPQSKTIYDDGIEREIPVTSVVILQGGDAEWRLVRRSQDLDRDDELMRQFAHDSKLLQASGIRYRLLTDSEIRASPQQLANWRRIIAWMSAARDYTLVEYRKEVIGLLRKRRVLTLRELEEFAGDAEFPLYAAAVFAELQIGTVHADLMTAALNPATLFSLQEI